MSKIEPNLLRDTFEPRRRDIVRQCHDDEDAYDIDEYSTYDFESLACLLKVMEGLLEYGPEKRISAEEALSCIPWTDHRKENELDEINNTET